jgi:hypothetical protein
MQLMILCASGRPPSPPQTPVPANAPSRADSIGNEWLMAFTTEPTDMQGTPYWYNRGTREVLWFCPSLKSKAGGSTAASQVRPPKIKPKAHDEAPQGGVSEATQVSDVLCASCPHINPEFLFLIYFRSGTITSRRTSGYPCDNKE